MSLYLKIAFESYLEISPKSKKEILEEFY